MADDANRIALLYDDDAYVEAGNRSPGGASPGAAGPMGRRVAGNEFLDAYLAHGEWDRMVALIYNDASARSLRKFVAAHPASSVAQRPVQMVNGHRFHNEFFPSPPARLVYNPCPPKEGFVWARQFGGPGSFSVCGVTHTLSDVKMVQELCRLVTAPFEPYDALICTSRAVTQMVRAVTGNYAAYLQERLGGAPRLRVRLETIPLGVNQEKFRPPSAQERKAQRAALRIAEDEVAILFVGRLLFHAKAHPFPMYEGIAQAAKAAGKKVHLILAGWSDAAKIKLFAEGASAFAPNVRVSIVDGARAEIRAGVWWAADIFTSLSDNIQETFGLVITEAMASGLPVVATDWNGYRDLVAHGETGFLVPTFMVSGATGDLTSRALGFDEIDYDHFLAESNQAIVVDAAAAAGAYRSLIADAALRQRMGAAGRERVLGQFTWQRVIKAYEHLWREQERERQAHVERKEALAGNYGRPAMYRAPEFTYAGYPTQVLRGDTLVQTSAAAEGRLHTLLASGLTNYAPNGRIVDPKLLAEVLRAAAVAVAISQLDGILARHGVSQTRSRTTVAWMLKYGLLNLSGPSK